MTYAPILPNAITFLRVPIAILVFKKIVDGSFGWALILYLIAATTDLIDGTFARRFKLQTKFGAIFEHIADTFMNTVAIAGFVQKDIMPLWVLLLGFTYMLSTWMIPKSLRRFRLIDKYIVVRPVMYGILLALIPVFLSLKSPKRLYAFSVVILYFFIAIKWKWNRVIYHITPVVRKDR